MTAFPVMFRQAEADDTGFVVHSWLESFHEGNRDMRAMRFGRYKAAMRRAIHDIVGRSLTLVACDPERPSHLYGFACGEARGPALHYVYVTQMRRNEGLARGLSDELLRRFQSPGWHEYTHRTFVGGKIADAHGIDFNPFAVAA